jgi:hypothetical protein
LDSDLDSSNVVPLRRRLTLAQRLAKLEEQPPVQPQPRRQRAMWGKR